MMIEWISQFNKNKRKLVIISAVIILALLMGAIYFIFLYGSEQAATIRINEFVIHNSTTLYDKDGDTPDWIELFNFGDERIWLGDIYISDNSELPLKFLLPDKYLEAGEYLIIFASGKKNAQDEIHTTFKLGDKDNCIVLSYDTDRIIDICEIGKMPTDISAGVNKDGQLRYYSVPTPNSVNNTLESETSDIVPAGTSTKKIVINEYMSSNLYTLKDSKGESVDWIELYNPNSHTIWIGDLYISDDAKKPKKSLLPDYEMAPYEYLLIYADSQSQSTDQQIYVPFSLSDNEQITLSNYNGIVIDSKTVEQLPDDISAGLYDESWGYFNEPTPGYENSKNISTSLNIRPVISVESYIYINEVMANNEYSILDSYGDTSDWIELYNPNDYDVSLEGYGLSDDENAGHKWVFPQGVTIKAQEYLLVFASGRDIVVEENNEIHTSFALGKDDAKLVLYQPNYALVDSFKLSATPGNVSVGRLSNGAYGYFPLPTPRAENIGGYLDKLEDSSNIILQDVYINEVSSSQIKYRRWKKQYFTEYIELYNSSEIAINLQGYCLVSGSQTPWVFPDVNIRPDEYLVVLLEGLPDENIQCINADLSISAQGETLVFKDDKGVIIDYYKTGFLPGDYSSGRQKNSGSQRYFFTKKTPGRENVFSSVTQYSAQPVLSHPGGIVDEASMYVEISAVNNSTIRYTLDGSVPTAASPVYTEKIFLDKDTVVRAAVFEQNKLPSLCVSATYIFSRNHTLPIVCLSTNPYNLFSSTFGIYDIGQGMEKGDYPYYHANFWFDWERPASVVYYESNGDLALAFDAGIQIAGQTSRAQDQKSFVIRIREEYGVNEIYYPLFQDNEVNEFKHILLRNSGQDWSATKIKDYYIHQSVKGYTDLDIMDGKPAALYLNGEYWGIYNIREKVNEDYLSSHHGVDPDNVTIIEGKGTVKAGSIDSWTELLRFVNNNNFSDDEMYQQLASRIDVDAFIDYAIVEIFFCNYDNGNIKYWRSNDEGGKWRPILFDMDASINAYNYTYNRLKHFLKRSNYSGIYYALNQNDGFREKFISRCEYFMNEVFTEQKISDDMDTIKNEISQEMKYHIDRWGTPFSYNVWNNNITSLKESILGRRKYFVEHLADEFQIDSEEIKKMFPWYS